MTPERPLYGNLKGPPRDCSSDNSRGTGGGGRGARTAVPGARAAPRAVVAQRGAQRPQPASPRVPSPAPAGPAAGTPRNPFLRLWENNISCFPLILHLRPSPPRTHLKGQFCLRGLRGHFAESKEKLDSALRELGQMAGRKQNCQKKKKDAGTRWALGAY